ncbi:right-handed parallel beta-helix repeat-containing protein [Bacillus safensis]|nr:right-handed parallel beta-helix repeat-containing protein [Bacillus safensis]MCY7566041.1 right-handed parallel beta-helix repeat-containing protein [Bacillus safensis]MCY7634673.1 right-handed parallel beta-helix repeat-containing protein [Bacillus safensis]MCY7647794.1 right-handed parallel beta-helix repeat-containing protein [Bacillus safensis]MEC3671728.1 right-handed parallel beta-helix repeat-containing protein [Bacillus safensis]MEC3684183.1 right-handed parallel beta-helix repeat-
MFNLKKQHTPSPHSKLIQELNDNARTTENALNELNRADERHQQSETAHKAEHITHRGKSVAHWLNSYWSRLVNLIVNHDGDDIKEVVDGRVSLDATIHPTLNDRLEYDFDQFEKKVNDMLSIVSLQPFLNKYGNFTKALQAALDLSKDRPIWLYIPSGGYTLRERVRIYKNTHITLQAGATIKRGFVGSMFVNGDSTESFTGYNGHGNLIIDGQGTIDSMGHEIKEQCSIFGFAHASGIIMRDITLRNVCGGHALDCAGNENVLIDNVTFEGFADYVGDRWFSAAVQVDLMRSSSNFGAFGAYDHTPTRNLTMQNCTIRKSAELGGYPRAIDSHTSTDGVLFSGIRFINNKVYDCTEWAVSGNKWQDVFIDGNSFENCSGGVRTLLPSVSSVYTQDKDGNPTGRVNKTKRHTITNNKFKNMSVDHAIQVFGRKGYQTIDLVVISKNQIDGTKRHAIHVSDVKHFVVDDNNMENIGHHGVLITRSTRGKVHHNTGREIQGNGVRIEEGNCDYVSVDDNTLEEIGFSGISVSGESEYVQVDKNTIMNAGKRGDEYDFILLMDGVKNSAVRNNTATGKTGRHGLYLTSKCSSIQHYGNRLKGAGKV